MAFLTKIQIGSTLYDLKDAEARASLAQLGLDLAALEKALSDHAAANVESFAGVAKSLEDASAATAKALSDAKAYTDAQIGAIKHFDVYVMEEGEALPTASEDTMFVLYMKPDNAEAGAYIEYITIRKGEEGSYTYAWEQIGSTVVSLTNYATTKYVDDEIKGVEDALAAHAEANEASFKSVNDAIDGINGELDGLGDLATKNEVKGTVPSHTVSGQKATGSATASTEISTKTETREISVNGSTTAEGTVSGTVVAKGNVSVTIENSSELAAIDRGDYTPAGSVAGSLTNATFNAVKSAGTAASFTEGTFTPATLGYEAAECSYVDSAFIASVGEGEEAEVLKLTPVTAKTFTASKINSFNGGSKAADVFTANVPAAIEAHTVGMSDLVFTGELAKDLKVTNVTYSKASGANAGFTGESAEITANFSGTASAVTASGSFQDEVVTGANTTINAISLDVSEVTIAATEITSK